MTDRNLAIDSIKGIMIIFVVFGHIVYVGEFKYLFNVFREFIYIFHMPIFLMLSGYLFRCELSTSWLKTIFSKLVIPYIFSFSCYLVILYYVGIWGGIEVSNHINGFQDALKAIIISPFASYWYLHSLILFSLFFYISSLISYKLNFNKLTLPLTLLLYSVFHFLFFESNFKFFYWVSGYIWLGYIYHYCLKNYRNDDLFISCLSVFIVILSIVISGKVIGFEFQRSLISLVILFFLYFLFKRFNCRVLEFIGRNSLLIFLFHVYFLNFAKFLSGFLLYFDESGTFFVIFSLLISVLGSIFIGLVMDCLNLSKYILGCDNGIK
ncbi:acyltransferase family protein [Aliivibrio fischeri]|uniref:acyltransferase family protein n=1 Tax=Aliivibrio fischeri TaxID=668 RepID=UPI00105D6DBF|nr:acyltransferase family protein [Aliivibrio fischeri]TDM56052.1 hypothetical protein VFFQA001_01035 [Aliivibrio fischeri]